VTILLLHFCEFAQETDDFLYMWNWICGCFCKVSGYA